MLGPCGGPIVSGAIPRRTGLVGRGFDSDVVRLFEIHSGYGYDFDVRCDLVDCGEVSSVCVLHYSLCGVFLFHSWRLAVVANHCYFFWSLG